MTDSTIGGYIVPTGGVAYDQELRDIFQAFIRAVVAMDGTLVRPRWQQVPLPTPDINTDWCAFGVKVTEPNDSPYFEQQDDSAVSIRHESIQVLISFYGPSSESNINLLKDGLAIPQNIAQLSQFQIKFVSVDQIIAAPDFLNQQWVQRHDMTATFRRKTQRTVPIRTFENFQINLKNS